MCNGKVHITPIEKTPTLLKAYSIKHNWRDTVRNILWNFPRDTDPFKFLFNLMHFVQNTVKMKSMNAILASCRFLPYPFLQNSWLSLLSSFILSTQTECSSHHFVMTHLTVKKKFHKRCSSSSCPRGKYAKLGIILSTTGTESWV